MAQTWAHSRPAIGEYRAAIAVMARTTTRETGKARKRVLWPFWWRRAQKMTRAMASPEKSEHGGVRAWPNIEALPTNVQAPTITRPKRNLKKCFSVRNERTKQTIGVRKKLMMSRSKTS
jgi:hypothetical protein